MRKLLVFLVALCGLTLIHVGSAEATTGVPQYIQNRLDSSGPIGMCQQPDCSGRLDWIAINRGERSDNRFLDATAVIYAATARVITYRLVSGVWTVSGCRTTTKSNPIVSFYGGSTAPAQVRLTAGITC